MRDIRNKVYPWYSVGELASLCGISDDAMSDILRQTRLWSPQKLPGVKRRFLLSDIQNEFPSLWDSILEAIQLNEQLRDPRNTANPGEDDS